MKKFNKVIKIEVEADQIAQTLLSKLDNKFAHAENVVESIIGTMNEHGLSMLFNALNGYSPEVDFSIGQEVEVKNVNTYGFWTEESKANGCSVRGEVKQAVIKTIDLYSNEKLEIEYNVPKTDGSYKQETKWVSHLNCNQLVYSRDKAISLVE